jgi:hypothetical protein
MKLGFWLIASFVFLHGCASVTVTTPVEPDFDKSRIYNAPFDGTWNRAVDWFAEHNVIIDKIEKPSGLLTARYTLETSDLLLNCGKINVQGVLGEPNIKRLGSLNVTVRPVDQESTRVNVNFFGEYELKAKDAWDGRLIVREGTCVSTGELEEQLLNFVGRK